MTNFEMVERLRMKANVSYEEAKAALEASNWDLLDAMVLLEREGKVKSEDEASYTTKEETVNQPGKDHDFKGVMGKVGKKIAAAINYLCRNSFEIARKDNVVLTLPVLVVLLCLIFALWPTLALLIIGLFFGFRYAFRGPDLDKAPLNNAMDKAAGVAESIKQDVQGRQDEKQD